MVKPPNKGKPFKKGDPSPNPKGRGSTYENFNERSKFIMEKYSIGEVIDLLKAAKDPKHEKHKQARGISMRDMMIMTTWFSAITTEGKISAQSLLDRTLGKVSDHVVVEQNVNHVDHRKQADTKAEDMLSRLKKRREAAKVVH